MLWLKRIGRYFIKTWNHLSGDWQVVADTSIPVQKLNHTLEQASNPSASFYALLTIATTIATFGLLANNAATIIGAMIVAPLMNPIVTLSYALISFQRRLLERGFLTLLTGIALVMSISFVVTYLVGTKVVGFQILARVEPSLIDLGIAIASGAAAGLAYSRRSVSNALPGVAIAVALVPPLCVTGIGLALGEDMAVDLGLAFGTYDQVLNIASGSFLLFVTNLAGIIFCAGLVFLIQGYGSWRKAFMNMFLTLAILGLLSLPLSVQLQNQLLRNKIIYSLDRLARNYPEPQDWLRDWLTDVDAFDMYVANRNGRIYIRMNVVAPNGFLSQEDVNLMQEFLSQELEKPVELEINLFPYKILKQGLLSTPNKDLDRV